MTQASIALRTTPPYPGLQMVQDINQALQALGTDFAGPSDPAAFAGPYMTWADTASGQRKRRNAANTTWVVEGSLYRNHLAVFAQNEIPTVDIGPIYVSGLGVMAWNGAAYAIDGPALFTILYPNGGTEAAPAPVAVNARYVLANPFPGAHVMCEAQLRYTDGWSSTGWFTETAKSYGTRASQLNGGSIIVRTGVTDVTATPDGAGTATNGTLLNPVQSRVLVWRVRG